MDFPLLSLFDFFFLTIYHLSLLFFFPFTYFRTTCIVHISSSVCASSSLLFFSCTTRYTSQALGYFFFSPSLLGPFVYIYNSLSSFVLLPSFFSSFFLPSFLQSPSLSFSLYLFRPLSLSSPS